MSEPRTLGELLAWISTEEVSVHGEVGYLEGKADALDITEQHLRRILYGTDTEPGLVERIKDAQGRYFAAGETVTNANTHALQAEIGDGRGTPREGEGNDHG